jgi:hypothetical protein
MTWQQDVKRIISVEVVHNHVCSDDECVTTNDIAGSNVAEDNEEKVDEP